MTAWHTLVLPLMKHFRGKRAAILKEACPELFDSRPRRICDLGGSRHFWASLPIDLSVKQITIYNISHSETGHTTGVAASIPIVLYDGVHLPVADAEFDLLISNSVIEHVPPTARKPLVAEMLRSSRRVVVQTPAKEFPIEPHFLMPFIHWLPRALGRRLVRLSPWYLLARPGSARANSYFDEVSLLDGPEVADLFPRGALFRERFIGLTKSYIVSTTKAGPL